MHFASDILIPPPLAEQTHLAQTVLSYGQLRTDSFPLPCKATKPTLVCFSTLFYTLHSLRSTKLVGLLGVVSSNIRGPKSAALHDVDLRPFCYFVTFRPRSCILCPGRSRPLHSNSTLFYRLCEIGSYYQPG